MNPQKRMRSWSWLLLAMFGLAAGCNGGDSPACDEICDKIVECDSQEDREDCMDQCEIFQDIMQSGVYNSTADCILDTACDAPLDPLECMVSAIEEIPDSVLDSFIDAVCEKVVECNSLIEKENCIDEVQEDEGVFMFKMLKQSVRDCVQNCITEKTCEELLGGDVFEDCSTECGFLLDID